MRLPAWLRPSLVAVPLALLLVSACGRQSLLSEADFDGGGVVDLRRPSSDGPPPDLGGVDQGGGDDGGESDLGGLVVTGLTVEPPLLTLVSGTQGALVATATYSDGSSAEVTAQAMWSVDDPAVAVVAQGLVTAVGPGPATVTARFGGQLARSQVVVEAAKITSVTVTPAQAQSALGGFVQFTAVALRSDGSKQDVTATAVWTSSDPAVASVAPGGLARGLAAGTVTITATIVGVTGKATLTVSKAVLQSIQVTPTNPVLAVGVTVPMFATATYSDGSIADVTATATWSSSAPAVLAIARGGQVTGLAPGTSIVTATVGNVGGSTSVTVAAARLVSLAVTPAAATLAVGGTVQLKATGTYADNSTADLTRSVAWQSSAANVAAVGNAPGSQGRVTGLAAGAALITATSGGLQGRAAITVTAAKLQSLAISPTTVVTAKGTQIRFTVKGTYSDNSVVDLTAVVTWSSDNPLIATISNAPGQSGLASALGVGATFIRATLGGVTAATTISVSAAKLTSITITPANPSLPVGTRQAMKATGTYSDKTTADLTAQVAWATINPAVATVSNAPGAEGQVTAVQAGATNLLATYQGISGFTAITVTAPILRQLVLAPLDPSRPRGQQVQFGAIAIYSNNTQQNVTLLARWTSASPNVATINASGLATTVAAGRTTISASFGGLTATTTLTVSGAVLVAIQIFPPGPTLAAGTTVQLQATAIYSDMTSQAITAQATWASADVQIATVTSGGGGGGPPGRVTGVKAGRTTISATWNGVTGTTTVNVSPAVLVAVTVFPAALTLAPGSLRQLTATALYSDNTSQNVTGQATWISSANLVVGVGNGGGNRGVIRALAPGQATITATYQGVTGSARITVAVATVVAIQITPLQPKVARGVPVQFRAVAILSDNSSQEITGLATWTSSNPQVAQIGNGFNRGGQAQTLGPGVTTISASWSGVTGTTTLTVSAANLKTIQLTPIQPLLPAGFLTQFQATGLYDDNSAQDLTQLCTWVSTAPLIASVSDTAGSRGRVLPIGAGSATISASYQGLTGSTKVTVTAATLLSIAVQPGRAMIAVGGGQSYVALGTFSDGSKLDVTRYVTWFSSDSTVAAVSNAYGFWGEAKGLAKGTVTISAVRANITGQGQLVVQ